MSDTGAIPPPLSPANSRPSTPILPRHGLEAQSAESVLGKRSAEDSNVSEANKKPVLIKDEPASAIDSTEASPTDSTSAMPSTDSQPTKNEVDSTSSSKNSLSTQIDRSFKMRAQSCYGYIHNLLNVQRPRLDQSFTSLENATDRLFVYHVYQHQPDAPERVAIMENKLEEGAQQVLSRFVQLDHRFQHYLAQREFETPLEEQMLISRLLYSAEKDDLRRIKYPPPPPPKPTPTPVPVASSSSSAYASSASTHRPRAASSSAPAQQTPVAHHTSSSSTTPATPASSHPSTSYSTPASASTSTASSSSSSSSSSSTNLAAALAQNHRALAEKMQQYNSFRKMSESRALSAGENDLAMRLYAEIQRLSQERSQFSAALSAKPQ